MPSTLMDFALTKKGNSRAVRAPIKLILTMLEPKTFPKAISVCPDNAALVLTNSSGADVPNETIVRPIKSVDILNLRATSEDASTK